MAKKKSKKNIQSQLTTKKLSLIFYIKEAGKYIYVSETLSKYTCRQNEELEVILINCSGEQLQASNNLDDDPALDMQEFSIDKNCYPAEALLMGIDQANFDSICIIDTNYLQNSFNLTEVFSRLNDRDNTICQLVFRDEDNSAILQKKAYSPFIISSGALLREILEKSSMPETFWNEFYRLADNYNLQISFAELNQVSAFKTVSRQKGLRKVIFRWKFLYNWLLAIPVKDIRNGNTKSRFFPYPSWYRLVFAVLAIVFFFLMPLLSLDAGISGDEEVNYRHAGYVLDYYTTMGEDTAALNTPVTKLQFYGQSFDNFTALFNRTFGIDHEMEWRHVFNSLAGWLTLIIASLLAVRIAGWRAGLFTMLLLFFSPRFLGHSYNNPKDIPFALGYIFSIYYFIMFLKRFPKPGNRVVFLSLLGVALAISIRIGGLLLIAYLFLFSGLYFLITSPRKSFLGKTNVNRLGKLLKYLLIITIGGYFLGLVFWPYALKNPINNPLEALNLMTNFSASLRQLFGGEIIWSDHLPWYYLSKYILISIPLIVLTGVVLFFFMFKKLKGNLNYLWMFLILFVFVFPVAYIINKESNVYGGWRHVLFIYPPMVIASGLGFEALTRSIKNKYVKIGAGLFVLFLAYHPVKHIIKNHPLEYIYYNQMVGGVDGAYGNFEMDYYYHSVRPATEWLLNYLEDRSDMDEIIIATNFAHTVKYYTRNNDNIKVVYIRYYDRGNSDWDYAIVANSYINPYQLQKDIWPPKNTIHTIKVDNSPVCAILERKTKDNYRAYQALQNKDYSKAISLYEESLKVQPDNESALMNLAIAYMETRQFNKSLQTITKCLEIYPDYDKALNVLGITYMNMNQLDHALGVFNKITQVNSKFVSAYYNIGVAYMRLNNSELAINYLKQAINVNKNYKPSYYALAEVLNRTGRQNEANQVLEIVNRMN